MSTAVPVLQDAAFVCSLGWILYRIWKIYQKPIEELVDLLGLDIPPVPDISLAGITAESALFYWKPPENQPPSLRYAIQVNGIRVGDFGREDASIQVTGLKPGHNYNIRVFSTNAANFSTFGPLIRLRTTPSQFAGTNSGTATHDELVNGSLNENEPATIRATPSHFDAILPSTSHQMLRESSGNQHNSRRTPSGRRNSTSIHNTENSLYPASGPGSNDDMESGGIIKQLTEKLEHSRREQQEVNRQIMEEENDSRRAISEITKERDGLKQILKEKEEGSSELRRQGNHLDKLNRTAQSRKAAKEKLLNQKLAERRKMQDDIARWAEEISAMSRDTEQMMREKFEITAAKKVEVAGVRKGISEDQILIKSLEEEIRIKGIQIKAIEKAREKPDSSVQEQERMRADKEYEESWETLAQAAQARLAILWRNCQQAQAENQQAQERLNAWISKRSIDPGLFAPAPALDFVPSIKSSRTRRARQVNSRTSTVSTSSAGYATGSNVFNNNVSTLKFPLSTPFFNMSNGMAIPPNPDHPGLRQTDVENSVDGGPMSPTANDLLPSNLFRDDDLANRRFSAAGGGHGPIGSVGFEIFAAKGPSPTETAAQGLHTPVSTRSRAGSFFSSPHESLHNLNNHQSGTASFADSDRQSINSTSVTGETNPLAASRIANLFTNKFNRQRGKSNAEPPLLGELKQGQSQSFPRNLDGDPIGSRRRRGSYGSWANPVAGLLNRSITVPSQSQEDSELISTRTGSGRRSRLNMFGSKFNGAESSHTPPRPSSTYSYDPGLGVSSSVDSQRYGWPVSESIPNRSSPLGSGWASGGPWSRGQSRRASLQHGSNSNLSIGSTPLESENYPGSLAKQVPEQLPIGTRPQSARRTATPKLNPAAPTFKTLFGHRDGKKAAKAEKPTDKSKNKELEKPEMDDADSQYEDWSPTNPRLSRDSQSVTTSTSVADSHDSLDRSTSGTPSEAVTGPKETLMQKITRKSSSSKFNFPRVKERGTGIFSNKRAGGESPSTIADEFNEVPSSIEHHQSGKSTNDSPQLGSAASPPPPPPPPQQQQAEKGGRATRSWQNIRRKSKKASNGRRDIEAWDDDDN